MWVDTSFDVDGHHVGVSVRRLEDPEAERIAAEMAWFAQRLLTGVDIEGIGWTTFLQQILSDSVDLTVAEDTLTQLESKWDLVVCRTLSVFVEANKLGPALRRYLGPESTTVS
jgi:hypothetical protein